MADTEVIDTLKLEINTLELKIADTESRVTALESNFGGIGTLMKQLERAVLNASDKGDALAGMVQANSPEQIVKNLIAHFEAVEK